MRVRPLLVGLGLAVLLLAACDAGDDTVAPTGKKDSGGGGPDATIDGQGNADVFVPTDPNSLCGKYGGYSKVETIVQGVVAAVAADCKIGAFFTALEDKDKAHRQDCLSKQFGEIMKCGGVVYAGSTDSLGTACRSMAEAHQDIDPQIRQADFDAFLIDVTTSLKAQGMATDDVAKIAPTLNSTSGDVVQSGDQDLSNSTCDGGPILDAGPEAAADTGIADAADGG